MKNFLLIMIVLLSIIGSTPYVQGEATAAPLFVREDCVWEYEYYSRFPLAEIIKYELLKYKFEGEKEVDGKIYHKLKHIHTSRWYIDEPDKEGVEEEDTDNVVALIREEDGKVWMRNESDIIIAQICTDSYYDWDWEERENVEEIQLFDFTAQPGDKISVWAYNNRVRVSETGYFQTEYEIEEIKNNTLWECYTAKYLFEAFNDHYATYNYVKGVGAIDVSTILGPQIISLIPDDGSWYESNFNNLYDLEGNVIYAGKGTVAGVESVKADARGDGRMYDVLGREVSKPQPGTIYIQNGRKFIAR